MRGGGVGEGAGEGAGEGVGTGVGLGVCATADGEKLETAKPAIPNAGSVLTNARRSNALLESLAFGFRLPSAFFLISISRYYLIIVPLPIPGTLGAPYFIRKTLALPNL